MKKKAVIISPLQLIGFLDQELKELPDKRKGDNKKYTVKHALKADFSVFFTQSPSFLQHQHLMKPKNGSITYYHQAVTPVIVSPSKKEVINLAPEFIKKQDGKTKEDCENAAIKRWLLRNTVEREKKQITLLGDDLYSRQPICELAL